MLLTLVLLIAWPVAEVFVAIQVAGAIGVLATILLLIASWPLGTWALRSQGAAAWRRLGGALAAGRTPGREVVDGGLVVLGGMFLVIPGFITDLLGLILLVAPTRVLVRRLLARNLQSRFVVQAARFTTPTRDYDVESTASDVDQPHLRP